MREIRLCGSVGGAAQLNASSLPLFPIDIHFFTYLFGFCVMSLSITSYTSGSFGNPLRRLQNLLRRFCKRRIQKPEFSIQNTGDVFYYSDS